jgi:hypothetical protein
MSGHLGQDADEENEASRTVLAFGLAEVLMERMRADQQPILEIMHAAEEYGAVSASEAAEFVLLHSIIHGKMSPKLIEELESVPEGRFWDVYPHACVVIPYLDMSPAMVMRLISFLSRAIGDLTFGLGASAIESWSKMHPDGGKAAVRELVSTLDPESVSANYVEPLVVGLSASDAASACALLVEIQSRTKFAGLALWVEHSLAKSGHIRWEKLLDDCRTQSCGCAEDVTATIVQILALSLGEPS